jgi:hypothetical protein
VNISRRKHLRSSQLRRIHTSVLFRISEYFRKGSPDSDHRFPMTRGICACPRTRLVSGPGDKDNSSIFIAASGTEDLNPCPGICSRMRENPILTACEPTLPTFVVTAICIFGHRSRRHDSKRGNPSAGRPRREGTRRSQLRRSSKRSQGSELAAVRGHPVESLYRRVNPS